MDNWEVIEQDELLDHPWVRLIVDTIARGGETRQYHYLESPIDSVATVAITANEHVILTRQYRHPVGRIIFDLPAGRAAPGETLIDGARRELQEETGYRAAEVQHLLSSNPFPGSLKVQQHIFFTRNPTPGPQNLDPGEELEVHLRPFEDVYAEVLAGEHLDGALNLGLLAARARGLI